MSNVPILRFSEFSGEWEEKEYGSIYSFYSTNSLSRDNLNYENGDVKNIHYGDIHTKFSTMFKLENETVPFINYDIDLSKIKDTSYCQVGDLIIADASEDYNDIGKTIEIISLNNEKILAGLHTFLARPDKDDIALGYVGYLLNSWNVRKQIMTIAQGTKVLSLSTGRLSKVKLNIPKTKLEQEKIASFFSVVDKKKDALSKKLELLKTYKKGVMQKIFSQEIRFKSDDGSEFEDWEEKKIGKIFEQRTERSTEDMELLSVTMSDGIKKRTDLAGKDSSSKDKSNYKVVHKNDIVYNSMRMWQGANGVSYYEGIVSPAYTVLKSNNNNSSDYFGYLFKTKTMIHIFQKNSQGLTSDTWNLKYPQLSTIKLNVPSLKEQIKIANFLSTIDKRIEQSTIELEKTQEFKKALLQRMFI